MKKGTLKTALTLLALSVVGGIAVVLLIALVTEGPDGVIQLIRTLFRGE